MAKYGTVVHAIAINQKENFSLSNPYLIIAILLILIIFILSLCVYNLYYKNKEYKLRCLVYSDYLEKHNYMHQYQQMLADENYLSGIKKLEKKMKKCKILRIIRIKRKK